MARAARWPGPGRSRRWRAARCCPSGPGPGRPGGPAAGRPALSSGPSVSTITMHSGRAAGCPGPAGCPARGPRAVPARVRAAAGRGQPGHGEPVPDAEVGHGDHADRGPAGQHPGRGADAALVAEAAHPGARADRALGRGAVPAADARAAASASRTSWWLTCIRRGFAEEAVVALGHDRDDHVVDADPRLFRDQQLARGVVDPAELHGRGEEHRGLGQPPLLRGEQPGAFAGPIEYGPAGRHRGAEQVTARVDHGDPGPGDAAAGRRRGLVPPHRGVAQAGPGTSSTDPAGPGGSRPTVMPRSVTRGIPRS